LTTLRTTFVLAAALTAAGVLAGCRAEEQGRPLVIKGTYRGKADTPLSAAKLRVLRDRVSSQSSSSDLAGGVAVLEQPSAEKPAPASKRLNDRLRTQEAPPSIPSGSSVRPPQGSQASTVNAAPNNDKALGERLRLQAGAPGAGKTSDVAKPQQPQSDAAKTAAPPQAAPQSPAPSGPPKN
jgi:hypothetical protein